MFQIVLHIFLCCGSIVAELVVELFGKGDLFSHRGVVEGDPAFRLKASANIIIPETSESGLPAVLQERNWS